MNFLKRIFGARMRAAFTMVALVAVALVVREAKAQQIVTYGGYTNVLLLCQMTNNTGTNSLTFTNTQYQGTAILTVISTNLAGTLPTLGVTLQDSWDGGTTWTNTPFTLTNTTGPGLAWTNFQIAGRAPILRTTNIFGGTSPQYGYSVSLFAPLRYKQ
jgi:hypothetical protein